MASVVLPSHGHGMPETPTGRGTSHLVKAHVGIPATFFRRIALMLLLDGYSDGACFHQKPANLIRMYAGMSGPSPGHRVAAPGFGGLHRSWMSRLPGSRHVHHPPSMAAQPIAPGCPKAWFYVVQNGSNRGSERLTKCSNCLPSWSHAGGSAAKTASMLPHCA